MKKNPLTCSEIAEHLCAELDEKIDSPRCREIKAHIAGCANCAAILDSLKKTVQLYRQAPPSKVSARCRTALFALLEQDRERKEAPRRKSGRE